MEVQKKVIALFRESPTLYVSRGKFTMCSYMRQAFPMAKQISWHYISRKV
jgi:hypothetical protein